MGVYWCSTTRFVRSSLMTCAAAVDTHFIVAALMYAALFGQVEAAELLIRLGADLNAREKRSKRETCLCA